ncbi:type II secretion system protein GspE, partial [bacterium]|nr:type II secretion system protein GspE [bacterium]
LVDMGVEPFLVSSTLVCVVSQRLVRTLCNKCKKVHKPSPEILKRLGLAAARATTIKFYQAVGCDECMKTGYKGRTAIFEVMEVGDAIAPLIMKNSDTGSIRQKAVQHGMVPLIEDGIRILKEGKTSIEEVLGVAFADKEG